MCTPQAEGALQDAGKYAGEGASVTVEVREDAGSLAFVVSDDGAGFDTRGGKDPGAGFTNMLDRLGALGGTLRVEPPGKARESAAPSPREARVRAVGGATRFDRVDAPSLPCPV